MKQVIIMRHAKSSWETSSLSDHQRGLNDRGIADTPIIAKQIIAKDILPKAVYSSDSERTRQTLSLLNSELHLTNLFFTRKLYLASEHEILKVIRQADDKFSCILVLAHNPGITDAFNFLANVHIDNVPTAGVGCISFKVNSFSEIEPKTGSLDYFIYPKML